MIFNGYVNQPKGHSLIGFIQHLHFVSENKGYQIRKSLHLDLIRDPVPVDARCLMTSHDNPMIYNGFTVTTGSLFDHCLIFQTT